MASGERSASHDLDSDSPSSRPLGAAAQHLLVFDDIFERSLPLNIGLGISMSDRPGTPGIKRSDTPRPRSMLFNNNDNTTTTTKTNPASPSEVAAVASSAQAGTQQPHQSIFTLSPSSPSLELFDFEHQGGTHTFADFGTAAMPSSEPHTTNDQAPHASESDSSSSSSGSYGSPMSSFSFSTAHSELEDEDGSGGGGMRIDRRSREPGAGGMSFDTTLTLPSPAPLSPLFCMTSSPMMTTFGDDVNAGAFGSASGSGKGKQRADTMMSLDSMAYMDDPPPQYDSDEEQGAGVHFSSSSQSSRRQSRPASHLVFTEGVAGPSTWRISPSSSMHEQERLSNEQFNVSPLPASPSRDDVVAPAPMYAPTQTSSALTLAIQRAETPRLTAGIPTPTKDTLEMSQSGEADAASSLLEQSISAEDSPPRSLEDPSESAPTDEEQDTSASVVSEPIATPTILPQDVRLDLVAPLFLTLPMSLSRPRTPLPRNTSTLASSNPSLDPREPPSPAFPAPTVSTIQIVAPEGPSASSSSSASVHSSSSSIRTHGSASSSASRGGKLVRSMSLGLQKMKLRRSGAGASTASTSSMRASPAEITLSSAEQTSALSEPTSPAPAPAPILSPPVERTPSFVVSTGSTGVDKKRRTNMGAAKNKRLLIHPPGLTRSKTMPPLPILRLSASASASTTSLSLSTCPPSPHTHAHVLDLDLEMGMTPAGMEASQMTVKPRSAMKDFFNEVLPIELRLEVFAWLVKLFVDELEGWKNAGKDEEGQGQNGYGWSWSAEKAGKTRWVGWEAGVRELVKISQVCKAWQALVFDGQLWATLGGSPALPPSLLSRISASAGPFVHSLQLSGYSSLTPDELLAITANISTSGPDHAPSIIPVQHSSMHGLEHWSTNITSLNLSGCLALTTRSLHKVLGSCPLLENLCLRGLGAVTNTTCILIGDAHPGLVSLDLGRCLNMDAFGVTFVCEAVERRRTSALLALSSQTSTAASASARKSVVSPLKELRLSGLKRASEWTLSTIARTFPLLEVLDLSYVSSLSDVAIARFVECQPDHAELRHWMSTTAAATGSYPLPLPLSSTTTQRSRQLGMTAASGITRSATLPSVPTLGSSSHYAQPIMTNANTDLDPDAIPAFIELTARQVGLDPMDRALYRRRVTRLRHLSLSHCPSLTSTACSSLAHALPRLEILELGGIGAGLEDDGLVRLLKTTKMLRKLDLEDASRIGDAVLEALTPPAPAPAPTTTPIIPPIGLVENATPTAALPIDIPGPMRARRAATAPVRGLVSTSVPSPSTSVSSTGSGILSSSPSSTPKKPVIVHPGERLEHLIISYAALISPEAITTLVQRCEKLCVLEADNTRINDVAVRAFVEARMNAKQKAKAAAKAAEGSTPSVDAVIPSAVQPPSQSSNTEPEPRLVAIDCASVGRVLIDDLASRSLTRPRAGFRHWDARNFGYADGRDGDAIPNAAFGPGMEECDESRVVLKSFRGWQTVDRWMIERAKRVKAKEALAAAAAANAASANGSGKDGREGSKKWFGRRDGTRSRSRSGAATPGSPFGDGEDDDRGCTIM